MTPIAFAVALCASAQPLTQEELSANKDALREQYKGEPCGLTGFRDGDHLYIAADVPGFDRELPVDRVIAVVDAKTHKRLDAWSDLLPDGSATVCHPSLDPVSLSPMRAAALLHGEEEQLFLFDGNIISPQLNWKTQGKDKQTFRVRKAVANGLFDLELKQGKNVEVYRYNGYFYGQPDTLNPYIVKARASSELAQQGDFTYSALEAIDGAAETTWAEATKGTGVGETLELTLDGAYPVTKLKLIPGCGFTESLWLKNERIKKLKITFDDKAEQVAELEDTRKPSDWKMIALNHDKPTTSLKLEILDVYPGTAWKDGCISEVDIEAKPLPSTGELAKAATFLGATCKTNWAAVTALWKTTGKAATFHALEDVNKRLKKPDLLDLSMKDEMHLDSIGINKCEDVSALAGTLPKDDLAVRLCAMKFEDVRHAFGDPPEKKRSRYLQYPFAGGKLNIWTKDQVTSAKLDCTP
jgi:hypothetical protein